MTINNHSFKKIETMRKMFIQELLVPTDAIGEVATVLHEHEIINEITGSDEEQEMIALEVRYQKEQKEAIKQIIGIIDEYDNSVNVYSEEEDK